MVQTMTHICEKTGKAHHFSITNNDGVRTCDDCSVVENDITREPEPPYTHPFKSSNRPGLGANEPCADCGNPRSDAWHGPDALIGIDNIAVTVYQLDQIATFLNREPLCTGPAPTCLHAEALRPLTRQEKAKNWQCRPFYAYNPQRLCLACRAYWHTCEAMTCLMDWQRRQEVTPK